MGIKLAPLNSPAELTQKSEIRQFVMLNITLTSVRYFTLYIFTMKLASFSLDLDCVCTTRKNKNEQKIKFKKSKCFVLERTAVFTSQRPQFPWRGCGFSGVSRISRCSAAPVPTAAAAAGLLQDVTLSVKCFGQYTQSTGLLNALESHQRIVCR
jgi:hypothetical protein